MDAFHWGQFPTNSAVAGTSEIFSSSFAVLTDDTASTYNDNWNSEQKPYDMPSMFYAPSTVAPVTPVVHDSSLDFNAARYDSSHIFRQPSYDLQSYHNPYHHPYHHSQHYNPDPMVVKHDVFQQYQNDSHPSPCPGTTQTAITQLEDSGIVKGRRPSSVSPMNPPSKSPYGSCESGTDKDGSPFASEVISTDLEGPDDVRVMCLACKGLYPSRRSLTGHIGRNEKCREIIDQVAAGANPVAPGTESALRAGALTNGQDGLSPVCPYCDRFISHYKGNIRRHINQCGKNSANSRRPRSEKEKDKKRRRKMEEGPPPILHEGFEPTHKPYSSSVMNGMDQVCQFLPPVVEQAQQPLHMVMPDQIMHSPFQNVVLPTEPSPPSVKKEPEPPEDAYICGQCEFVTIYKGNMKRHLNTCHPAPDCKDLKEWDRKLESMRATSLGISREEMLNRLQAHKMNSTRGRKPRSRHPPADLPSNMPPTANLPTVNSDYTRNVDMVNAPSYNAQTHFDYEMGSYL